MDPFRRPPETAISMKNRIRVVAMSDTHNQHDKVDVPEGDILIHAGDATMNGTLEETKAFLEWFSALPHPRKYFVPGNHELNLEELEHTSPGSIRQICRHYGIEGLVHEFSNKDDRSYPRIFGSPYVPEFGEWAFMPTEESRRWRWEDVPYGLHHPKQKEAPDIVVTHGPPRGILDHTVNDENVGDPVLNAYFLRARRPILHLFGHIHEMGGGLQQPNGSGHTHLNVAVLDENYLLRGKPAIVDMVRSEGRWVYRDVGIEPYASITIHY